ncbi:MAG: FG-GAP-like repeat-containing protein, partial [Candidatus Krumholzibacteriia bacterium]
QTPSVVHDASTPMGTQTFSVTVTSQGGPVIGATVCLWKPGDLYAVGRTNFSGVATLHMRAEAPGTAQLTVSGAGVLPYRSSVTVQSAAGAALRATGVLLVDDAGPGTIGNGNGLLEASEEVLLHLEVRNEGSGTANEVSFLAQSSDPFLAIPDPQVQVGNVPPGQAVLSQPLRVRLSDLVLDHHRVGIDVVLQSQGWTWEDRVYVDLLQVDPQLVGLSVDDPNRNETPEANETYDLLLEFKNYGFAQLDAATATLFSSDPDVTVLEGSASLGDVVHLASGTVTFQVRESDVSEPNPMFVLLMNAAGRVWSFVIETRRPQPPTALTADASGGPTIMRLSWSPSPSADVAGYHVYQAPALLGPWSRANQDLIRNATYFRDDGLTGSAEYHYVAVAVDSSGNESFFSDAVITTTNPVQNGGWPRLMGQWSNCTPVVVDLDGDLQMEVLAGADRVYAWHADGSEVLDGDGDAATSGVWTTFGSTFAAGIAAGDLDGDGLDEVVACSWDTREVCALDGDGSILPGWPRSIVSTTHGIWATPAIADLDLDGTLEIVVLALDGRLYAWHADGSEVLDGDSDPATQGVFFAMPGLPTWSRGAPAVANILTDDPTPEIVFGGTDDRIYMLRADGSTPQGWPRVVGDEVTSAPSIGDIDGDGALEVAVPAKDGFLYVLRGDGSDLAGWPRAFETHWGSLTPSVALHDFDGDGRLELVVGGSTGATENGELWMFDWQGSVVAGWPVDVGSAAEASPVLGDLDTDGVPEILYGGETGFMYGFRADGTLAPGFPIKLGAEMRATPTITDVDRDGDVDVVFSGWDQQVYVFDFEGGYVRSKVPWGTFKGNNLRNALYAYRDPTGTDIEGPALPLRTRLHGNVPNPFNPVTTIEFDVAGASRQRTRLVIYDVHGRRVRTLVDDTLAPGRYEKLWYGLDDAGRPRASGVYFYRLETPQITESRKMILLR